MFLNSLPPWEASKALEFTFTTTFFTTLHNDGIYQVSVLSIHFSDFCESTGNCYALTEKYGVVVPLKFQLSSYQTKYFEFESSSLFADGTLFVLGQ